MFDGSGDVALSDVRDLVSQDGRELALGPRCSYQPGVDADEAARCRERVQRFVFDHEEREPEVAAIGRCDEPVPERLNVLLDQGIVDEGQPGPDLAHERFAERALVGRRERLLRRVAEVGKPHLRAQSARETHHATDHREQRQARSDRHGAAAPGAGGASPPMETRLGLVRRHERLHGKGWVGRQ